MCDACVEKKVAPAVAGVPAPKIYSHQAGPHKFLVFGAKTGWIGNIVVEMLKAQGKTVVVAETRLEDREAVARELDAVKPTHVLSAAGVTGRPNVDWCEDHKQEVIRANVIGALTLADLCSMRKIHMTNFATGCIYEYNESHPIGGKGFTEEDEPNYFKSFYSETKVYLEKMIKHFDNVLQLRLRMPISDDLHPRNFVTKITNYAKVVDVPNSMTILHDLLPVALHMSEKGLTGVYNFTNPGAISHNEILKMYKKYIDPKFEWVNFSLEEQAKILKAGRSNNTLECAKLLAHVPEIPVEEVHVAMEKCFQRMAKNLAAHPVPLPAAHH